jgi:signal peptidase I
MLTTHASRPLQLAWPLLTDSLAKSYDERQEIINSNNSGAIFGLFMEATTTTWPKTSNQLSARVQHETRQEMKSVVARTLAVSLLVTVGPLNHYCLGFSSTSPTEATRTSGRGSGKPNENFPEAESFSVPLTAERPAPTTAKGTLNRLWNDPRPVTSLIRDALDSKASAGEESSDGSINGGGGGGSGEIPYCLVSEAFMVDRRHKFLISLFPRGRFAAGSSTSFKANKGPAAAYLRYIPNYYGDEVDIAWRLKLVDTRTNTSLPIITSGGLPRSNTTWSAAMTFCVDNEDIESCGRAADWGSSGWYQQPICEAVASGSIEARVDITLFGSRKKESSFALPPRGAVGAAYRSGTDAGRAGKPLEGGDETNPRLQERSFRVGEVIIPMAGHPNEKILEDSFVTAGTDYRIMTMADKDGRPIFSTNDVPEDERKNVRLAIRPCGWKLQKQMNQQQNKKVFDWPVEVRAGLLSTSALSRFNFAASFPRFVSTFQRDKTAVLLVIALALLPVPVTLIGRNFVSLYAIPSASMDPTLAKGDVLLVEKFPGAFDRTSRGDIVLFRPPSALTQIAGSINGNSLFVKRVVGLPGDTNILLDPETKEVTLNNGEKAAGPDRNLCEDEPLKLIDRFLETGKGKSIDKLEDGEVYVLGDCKTVSIDSRVFGVLPAENIAGKPLGRIWPPSRVTFKEL